MTDLEWIQTCTSDVAVESLKVVEEVLSCLDLAEEGIEPFPSWVWGSHNYNSSEDDQYRAIRMKFVRMLERYGVVKSGELDTSVGQHGIVRITANRETVVKVRDLLKDRIYGDPAPITRKVFVGHGLARDWLELKYLLHDRIGLDVIEFNLQSAAGSATTERIGEMLKLAEFAFLVLTAEDRHADGILHARENVIHELGLFQARLGPRKAIVLLQDGCAEFSNIEGLTQVRFKAGEILAKSEEIRQVLEREGIIPGPLVP